MTLSHIVFIIISAVALIGAVGVVASRNLFRAALFLVLSFVGVAGFYILLDAGILGMIQLLVYVGAISILIIFAIMVSRRLMAPDYVARNEQWIGGLVVAIALFAVLTVILVSVTWPTSVASVADDLISLLGESLVTPEMFLLPFEVASVLLLVALVGAVIIARER
ncbi:NADH-quinone oxidoreductase subunit J [Chloroflexota bacterium]